MRLFYQDDSVRLYLGDAREADFTADVLITDPPYGVAFNGKGTKWTRAAGGYASTDDDPELGPCVVRATLARVERAAVFTGIRGLYNYPPPRDIGCVYCPSGAGRGPWGFTCFNPVLFYGTPPPSKGQAPTSILSFDRADTNEHPCPKPMRWMRWLVGLASNQGETIFDPFAGSGTTLRAAKDLGRQGIGVEIDGDYCELAARRLAQEVLPLGDVA